MRHVSVPHQVRFRRHGVSSRRVFARLRHTNNAYTRSNPQVIEPNPGPTTRNEDGTKTLRLRQHGNKPLPLPPLLDPIAIAAKERYKKPKIERKEQDVELTEFQKELGANPYGKPKYNQLVVGARLADTVK